MRVDLLTIFPDFFQVLNLSLLGKAQEDNLISIRAHDLRDWTTDRHRTVDDSPYGGGAGMVMRPDIWGRAIDDILSVPCSSSRLGAYTDSGAQRGQSVRRVLAIPTPAGTLLKQHHAQDLLNADQIILACGRYEGIDERVADYYRNEEIEVFEFSLGDYVLNGGESAALVLIETIGRLIDGVIGNPESLAEESHNESGLLEYPTFTRPKNWRGMDVPEILSSGNHAAISSWRRDASLIRTAHRRPDLIDHLLIENLTPHDRQILASAGKVVHPLRTDVTLRMGRPGDEISLTTLARDTFPLACPDFITDEAIQIFMDENFTEDIFARMLASPDQYRIIVVETQGDKKDFLAYTLTILSGPDGMPVEMVRPGRIELGAAYLSKCYVRPEWHGSGIAGAMIERAVQDVESCGRNSQVVLATNISNKRAKKFYRRHGFNVVGRRTFMVGGIPNIDDVFVRNVTPSQP